MAFPVTRLRRLRTNPIIRKMISETTIQHDDLIMPLFVCPGKNVNNPISSMPGNSQLSVDLLVEECKKIVGVGVQSVLLFGIPEYKDEHGLVACQDNGIVQQAIHALRKEFNKDICIVADVCNCEYTTTGIAEPLSMATLIMISHWKHWRSSLYHLHKPAPTLLHPVI